MAFIKTAEVKVVVVLRLLIKVEIALLKVAGVTPSAAFHVLFAATEVSPSEVYLGMSVEVRLFGDVESLLVDVANMIMGPTAMSVLSYLSRFLAERSALHKN